MKKQKLESKFVRLQPDFFKIGKSADAGTVENCRVVPVGKRRDGGTRYWCLAHKADATAKYGRPADRCRAAGARPIGADETLKLDVDKYPGGIAIWGAVPPIFDSTPLALDRGIHVHARRILGGRKDIDKTFRVVKLHGGSLSKNGIVVSEMDAIYFMVSTVFNIEMKHISCSNCGYSHLDKDWFSVHPHQRHLCAGCGKYFMDSVRAVGNPIRQVQADFDIAPQQPKPSRKTLNLQQKDFPGGIQIWGSNPAIVWTSDSIEEEGIHIHAFDIVGEPPVHDDTYAEVTIDGLDLDPQMVRTLMAQNALPHIEGRVMSLTCKTCHSSEFDIGERAFTPSTSRTCSKCHGDLKRRGRLRKVIANPLVDILDKLASAAPRPLQKHSIGLLPETI